MSRRWQGILSGDSALATGERLGRRLFSLIPAQLRCRFCNAPFRGPYAGPFGKLGYTPSRKNPSICERCIERAPEGGALVPVSILFADVRGYTTIAERMSSVETTALLRRFYQAASKALLANDAILGQIAGDEVMAIFVPGLAGQGFPRRAVRAAEALLRAVGYGTERRQLARRRASGSAPARSTSATSAVVASRTSPRSATSPTPPPASRRRPAVGKSSSARRLIGRSRRAYPQAEAAGAPAQGQAGAGRELPLPYRLTLHPSFQPRAP